MLHGVVILVCRAIADEGSVRCTFVLDYPDGLGFAEKAEVRNTPKEDMEEIREGSSSRVTI